MKKDICFKELSKLITRTDRIGLEGKMSFEIKQNEIDKYIYRHLNGSTRVGFYTTFPNNLVKWSVLDFDLKGENHKTGFEDFETLYKAAKDVYCFLKDLKMKSNIELSKSKGLHIWILFDEEIYAKSVRLALMGILDEYNLIKKVEIFPKQDELNGKLGNFVWLPWCGKNVSENKTILVDENLNQLTEQKFLISKSSRITKIIDDYPLDISAEKEIKRDQEIIEIPNENLFKNKGLSVLLDKCLFLKWWSENQNDCSEIQWEAGISILKFFKDGYEYIHKVSETYKEKGGYSKNQTDRKIYERTDRAFKCNTIRFIFSGCANCKLKVNSPVGIVKQGLQDSDEKQKTDESLIKISDKFIMECCYNDERGDAELLQKLINDRLYDHSAQCWLFYENGIWKKDEKKETRKKILYLLADQYLKLAHKLDKRIINIETNFIAKSNGGNVDKEIDKDIKLLKNKKELLHKRAKQLNKRYRLDSVTELTTSYLPTKTADFDTDPYLLNLKNGTYNLKADIFKQYSINDRMMKQAGAEFDEKAKCTFTIDFLNKIFDKNDNVIRFVQQWMGVCLSGETDLQGFLYCYGKGANGKTTFFNMLRLLLNDYYMTLPIETLLLKNQNSTDEYQLARLHGARLIVASEIPENRRINENQIKDLTGGEMVNARHPYGKPFEFNPTHKLSLFGNHMLRIRGTDDGIWRRIFLLKFGVQIPEEKQIPMSKIQSIFKSELNGILNWALEGYREYKKNGKLFIPIEVKKATKEYRDDSDVLKVFISEKCEPNNTGKELANDVFNHYSNWCKNINEYPIFKTVRSFDIAMNERGFVVEKGSGNKTFIFGLKLIEN